MLLDTYQRPLGDLRISVTDRCNFRCTYCMPLDEYDWIEKQEILTFEEIVRLAKIFVQLGVDKIRLTGGEPLVRRDLEKLVSQLSPLPGLRDLCLTTNGSLLAEKAPALKAAGLRRVNVSLDTLNPEKFRAMTKRGDLDKVLEGLFAAKHSGLQPIRFIEYMDVGNSNGWLSEKVVPKAEILSKITSHYGLRETGRRGGSAPSVDYQVIDGTGDIGVIASVTEPFCSSCTRARLTADGKLVTCLFSARGHDLKALIRNGASDEKVRNVISAVWRIRTDRYSDARLEAMKSTHGYEAKAHKKIEMITLGG